MYQIALKMLFGDRAKFLTLVVGLTFTVLLLSQQGSLFCGLMLRTASSIFETGASIWVVDPQASSFNEVVEMKLSEVLRIRSVQGVKQAVPMTYSGSFAQADDGTTTVTQIVGLDDETLVGRPANLIEGSYEALNSPGAIIISKARSDRFGSPGLGDSFEINNHRVHVAGIVDTKKTFSPFPMVYTTVSQASALLPEKNKMLAFTLVEPEAGEDEEVLCQRINAQTGLKALRMWDFVWMTMKFWAANTGIPFNLGINVVMVIIIGTVICAQTLYAFMLENVRHFGTFKAVGIENAKLARLVLLQSLTVGLIGHGIGTGLMALIGLLNPANSPLAFYTPPHVVGITFVLVLGFCLFAALLSIVRVIKIDPAIVFRG
jgi:putative ABC transport system permease protein